MPGFKKGALRQLLKAPKSGPRVSHPRSVVNWPTYSGARRSCAGNSISLPPSRAPPSPNSARGVSPDSWRTRRAASGGGGQTGRFPYALAGSVPSPASGLHPVGNDMWRFRTNGRWPYPHFRTAGAPDWRIDPLPGNRPPHASKKLRKGLSETVEVGLVVIEMRRNPQQAVAR